MVNASKEYLYTAAKELTFNARGNNNIDLQFRTPEGAAGITVDLRTAGVTIGAYDFSANGSITETGELVITEIMWNAAEYNYIELHNPGNTAVSLDTLITDIDGVTHKFPKVNVAAKGFYVISRKVIERADVYPTSPNYLPLSASKDFDFLFIADPHNNGTRGRPRLAVNGRPTRLRPFFFGV